MKSVTSLLVGIALLVALPGRSAYAQTTNYWTNTGGGDYSNSANWAGVVPATTTDWAFFTNAPGSAYTVTFTDTATNGPLTVINDQVIFDLAGNGWTNAAIANLGTNNAPAEVTFTSTAGTGNIFVQGSVFNYLGPDTGPFSTINLSNVQMRITGHTVIQRANLNIDGPGTQLTIDGASAYQTYVSGTADVNQATLKINGYDGGYGTMFGTWGSGTGHAQLGFRDGAVLDTSGSYSAIYGEIIGYVYSTTMLFSNSTWNASYGTIQVGFNQSQISPSGYQGDLLLDNSTLNGRRMEINNWSASPALGGPGYRGAGRVTVQNGSTLNLSNGWLYIHPVVLYPTGGKTNELVLQNGTINLGGPTVDGWITNMAIMRTAGAITGKGSGPARVYSGAGSVFEIGNSIGTLTLSNANLELAAGSVALWEFGDTGLDQVLATGGSVSLLGTNLFSLAAGAPIPTSGVKYGLGMYDFVVASNLTYNPQYNNLSNLLSGTYGLVYGADYRYRSLTLDSGLQVLRLEFVPEPSTILLLLAGAWLLARSRPRRR